MSRVESLQVMSWAGVRFWARSLQSLEPAITATTVFSFASFKAVIIMPSKRLYLAPLMSA